MPNGGSCNALRTPFWRASATAPESATVSATTPALPVAVAEVTPIPTLSEWMLMLMAALLGIAAVVKTRAV